MKTALVSAIAAADHGVVACVSAAVEDSYLQSVTPTLHYEASQIGSTERHSPMRVF
jgi:hypothetical protein